MWIEPKTNWTREDVPLPEDFNRIEGNTKELKSLVEQLMSGAAHQPCFSVYLSEAFTATANSTTVIRYNNARINIQSAYDLSTGNFSPKKSGIYYIKARAVAVLWSPGVNEYATLCVYKNETKIDEVLMVTEPYYTEISLLAEMNADDYLSFRIANNSSSNLVVAPLPGFGVLSQVNALGVRLF